MLPAAGAPSHLTPHHLPSTNPHVQSGAYSAAISACGRAGQLAKALTIKDEMLAAGLPMTHNIRLALLHSCAGAWLLLLGSWGECMGWLAGGCL